jgi:hypothetical protein
LPRYAPLSQATVMECVVLVFYISACYPYDPMNCFSIHYITDFICMLDVTFYDDPANQVYLII